MTTSTWGGRHVHDPTVVRDGDGTYWMFSTDARSDGPVRAGVQVRTSLSRPPGLRPFDPTRDSDPCTPRDSDLDLRGLASAFPGTRSCTPRAPARV